MLAESFLEPLILKEIPVSVFSLCHTIGVKQYRVSGFELDMGGGERLRPEQTNGKGSGRIEFANLSAPQEQRTGMAGSQELKSAVEVQEPEEHGCASAYRCAIAEKLVQMIEDLHWVDAEGHS